MSASLTRVTSTHLIGLLCESLETIASLMDSMCALLDGVTSISTARLV